MLIIKLLALLLHLHNTWKSTGTRLNKMKKKSIYEIKHHDYISNSKKKYPSRVLFGLKQNLIHFPIKVPTETSLKGTV